MKLNKLTILMGVGALTYTSANLSLLNTQAALTAPTNYNYSYRQSNVDTVSGNNWAIRNNGGSAYSSLPTYTQTYDGQYYDYVHSGTEIVSGLTVYHTFNNSSTSWSNVSGSTYRPNNAATYIGSASGNGTTENKIYFKLNNQTNKDYYIYFDYSSTSMDVLFINTISSNQQITLSNGLYGDDLVFIRLFIPSYTEFILFTPSSSLTRFFDAWYLQDLGVSAAWTNGNSEGYTEGYNDGELDGYTDGYAEGYEVGISGVGMATIFTIAFGVIESIFNIQIFGGLTLGTIVVAPIAIALLWFILGIVSGVGGKKQ